MYKPMGKIFTITSLRSFRVSTISSLLSPRPNIIRENRQLLCSLPIYLFADVFNLVVEQNPDWQEREVKDNL